MNRTINFALAAAVACGTATLATQSVWAADHNNMAHSEMRMQMNMAPTLPPGVKAEEADSKDMQKTIEDVTKNAVKADEFDDVVDKLVKQDRERMKDMKDKDFKDLDAQAEKFQKAWKNKYGEDFSIDRSKVFSNALATEGEVLNTSQVLSNWPVNAQSGMGRHAGGQQLQSMEAANHKSGDIEQGTRIAVFHLPKAGEVPGVYVSMVDQSGWKIAVPDNRTGQQIHDDLLKNLTMLNNHQQEWPSDKNEAARAVVNCVMASVYGVGQ